jgi:hypothetical protein
VQPCESFDLDELEAPDTIAATLANPRSRIARSHGSTDTPGRARLDPAKARA